MLKHLKNFLGVRSRLEKYYGASNCSSCSFYAKSYFQRRNISSDANTNKDEKIKSPLVVLSDDGNTIICWHPEENFPYECSKPIPRFEPELNEADSVLKVQHRTEFKYRFDPDLTVEGVQKIPFSRFDLKHRYNRDLTIDALRKLTFTTKHGWYPNNQKKKRKPNPPVDREGI